jgi:prophage tail gpP-like protein
VEGGAGSSTSSVNGGAQVQKVTGRVVRRRYGSADEGTVLRIVGADLGWHLLNSCAPWKFNLQKCSYETLLKKVLLDGASWGFSGVRAGNDISRHLKLGRRGVAIQINPGVTIPIARIQVEPGEVWWDVLSLYAKRLGYLVNVSGDGYLQFFRPNYTQNTTYRLEYHRADDVDTVRNNVQAAALEETLEGRFSRVDLTWEQVFSPVANQNGDPNAGKYTASALATGSAFAYGPRFLYRRTGQDSETLSSSQGSQRADWTLRRGYFDSWTASYTVRGHYQLVTETGLYGREGVFWESDTMASVVDDVLGINGKHYVSAVRCRRSMAEGDVTEITVKKPDLLHAV